MQRCITKENKKHVNIFKKPPGMPRMMNIRSSYSIPEKNDVPFLFSSVMLPD